MSKVLVLVIALLVNISQPITAKGVTIVESINNLNNLFATQNPTTVIDKTITKLPQLHPKVNQPKATVKTHKLNMFAKINGTWIVWIDDKSYSQFSATNGLQEVNNFKIDFNYLQANEYTTKLKILYNNKTQFVSLGEFFKL